jgi:hypothetical protein
LVRDLAKTEIEKKISYKEEMKVTIPPVMLNWAHCLLFLLSPREINRGTSAAASSPIAC